MLFAPAYSASNEMKSGAGRYAILTPHLNGSCPFLFPGLSGRLQEMRFSLFLERRCAWGAFLLINLLLLAPAPAAARKHKEAPPPLEPAYVSALATANRFLTAWQNADLETGVLLLTDHAKQQTSELVLKNFFRGTGGRGFEIIRGRRLRPGRYSFPVVLARANLDGHEAQRKYSQIILSSAGKDDWAVDRLP
jgi:hypothetical protein